MWDKIIAMTIFTFAGDEAGDVSFTFEKGASRYFVVAAIATPSPETLRDLLVQVRRESKLPETYEFKFHSLTSSRLRKRVFYAIAHAEFEAWAVIVDKTSLPDTFRIMSGLDFYLYFVSELIRLIPVEKSQGSTMILDEFGSATRVRTELRRVLKARGIPKQFKRIVIRRSEIEPLIQIADLVAGAILRRDTRGETGAFEYVEKKIQRILEFN